MIYLIIAAICFSINWLLLRKTVLEYSIVASLIYLVLFIFVQSFDVLYVEYVFFFILPHLKDFRKMSKLNFVFLIYILFELVIGIVLEPFTSVSATFLTRFLPLVFVTGVDKHKIVNPKNKDDYEQRLLRLVVASELVLSAFLWIKRTNGDFFVVSHQPVGANLSLVGVFLSMDIALNKREGRDLHRLENIVYSFLFVILAMISGIRGYIVIIIPCAFYSIINYLFKGRRRKTWMIITGLMAVAILSLSHILSGSLASVVSGLDTSVGYRDLENKFLLQTLKEASPVKWLFGYGVAARGNRIGSAGLITVLAQGSQFYTKHLGEGAIVLNFWLTIVKDMGLIGLIIYLSMYIRLIPIGFKSNTDRRNGWILYALLYGFMLLYRTSCTNGLVELYIFAYVMNNRAFEIDEGGFEEELPSVGKRYAGVFQSDK